MRGIVGRYGTRAGITFFVIALRLGGVRLAYLLLHFVVPYYILLRPSIYRSVVPYLRRRFPTCGRMTLFRYAGKLVHEFSRAMIDQAATAVAGRNYFAIDVLRQEDLRGVFTRPGGVVLVMTHAGNWKALISTLPFAVKRVNLLLHRDPTAPTSGTWGIPEELDRATIINPTGPFGGLVQAAAALERGELVAIMGDRHWGGRTVAGMFLGDMVQVPVAPYRLGRITGARVVAVLTAKVAARRYELDFRELAGSTGLGGDATIEAEVAQAYLGFVEQFLRRHPFSWFNFYDFWQSNDGLDVAPSGENLRMPDGPSGGDDRPQGVGRDSLTDRSPGTARRLV